MTFIKREIRKNGRTRIYLKIASFIPKNKKLIVQPQIKDEPKQEIKPAETRKRTPREIFEYLLKYAKYTENVPKIQTSDKYKNCIWQLWLQGEENAPELVKKCLKSVKKHANGRNVIVLNEESLKEYIDIDSTIYKKYKQGLIVPAHFADYARLELLAKYGGTWVDSTIMFTAPLPEYITNHSFFMFKTAAGMYLDNAAKTVDIIHSIGWTGGVKMPYHLTSNWFIHSEAGNIITTTLLYLFKKCLIEEEKLPDYFTMHYLFTIAVMFNEDCKREYNKMQSTTHINPVYMQWRQNWKFTNQLLNEIVQNSTLHKLNYRIDPPPTAFWAMFWNMKYNIA